MHAMVSVGRGKGAFTFFTTDNVCKGLLHTEKLTVRQKDYSMHVAWSAVSLTSIFCLNQPLQSFLKHQLLLPDSVTTQWEVTMVKGTR